jgi:hypothetical protein
MPFSSDGDTIDFIYGVINWKHVGEQPVVPAAAQQEPELDIAAEAEPVSSDEPPAPETVEAPMQEQAVDEHDGSPVAEFEPFQQPTEDLRSPAVDFDPAEEPAAEIQEAPVHFAWEDGPLADADDVPALELDENAGLADRLWAARETAEAAKLGEGRTRTALYKALSLAYDFAIAAGETPADYAELLEESGVKAQARAPMTPIVKLVFGIDYDKARLTEFAAALSYARRQEIGLGAFQEFIEKQSGGLKALVAAERQARRPEPKVDTQGEEARRRLRNAPPISLSELPDTGEFALVVTRRGADGRHEPVAVVVDEALVERAIRRTA